MANLYLLPSFLAPDSKDHIPSAVLKAIGDTNIFVVERARTSRRYIRSLLQQYPLDQAKFIELDKHNIDVSKLEIKKILSKQENVGLLSEAGTPCIADPGAMVVNMARNQGYKICPLTGPSSIILGLMASGMNGQHFTFHGYLPIKDGPLSQKLKTISRIALKESSTQIFIETPYRNSKLIEKVVRLIDPSLHMTVAINLNGKDENIVTQSIQKWKGFRLGKEPAIYCIGTLEN